MKKTNFQGIQQPTIIKIDSIKEESESIKTFTFRHKLSADPGQFIMAWIPRIDMKPFGVSYKDNEKFSITVSNVGRFTKKLFKKKEGDKIGIQGPYGNGFGVEHEKVALVAGGYGTAPLAFLAEELVKNNKEVILVIGAKTKNELIYEERFKSSRINTFFCTDDGSYGKKGFTTQVLEEILKKESGIDFVYTVGPEIMMKKVIEITDEHDIGCEASLERYMKCGFGVCGQCCVDDTGERVCKTGPVYSKEYIKANIREFGEYKRNGTGEKVNL
ncbi:MAG: dihydroorotate dehydrogenase electron transfer subunit [Nanobdellota archaeon]